MFAADPTTADDSTDDNQTADEDRKEHFDERSEIHEVYWIACDANRRNGPQILNSDTLTVKGTDSGVSGVVDDYHFFNNEKNELITEITDEKEEYGLRKYRNDFAEPDEDMWTDAGSDHYGINIVGCHKIPADVASERFDVDYNKSTVDPIFVPVIENDDEEVIYDPVNHYGQSEDDTDDTDDSDATHADDVPDFPAEPEVVQEYLEEIPEDELNMQQAGCLSKLRRPEKSMSTLADQIGCSKNTVRTGCKKLLGDENYQNLLDRGKQLRNKDTDSYTEQMSSDHTENTNGNVDVDVDDDRIDDLESRIEQLEGIINTDAL